MAKARPQPKRSIAELRSKGITMMGGNWNSKDLILWLGDVAEALPDSLRYAVPMDMPTETLIALRIYHLFKVERKQGGG